MKQRQKDIALLHRFAEMGDAEAFSDIVGRYQDFVYGAYMRVLCNTADAEDAAQECFLRLARQAGSVKSSLAGWLHHHATAESLDEMERQAARWRREEVHNRMKASSNNEATWEEISPHVDKALDELPDELRLILIEHFLGRRTQAEIAAELGVSPATISRRVETGVEELRKKLKKAGLIVSAALLALLVAEHAVTAAPATLTAALGKLAMSGVNSGATAGSTGTGAGGLTGAAKIKIAAVVIAALAVGGVVARNITRMVGHPPAADQGQFRVSGDPLDLRFVGVRPDGGDEILDPQGQKISEMILPIWHYMWSNRAWQRDFIIEPPKTDEPLLFMPFNRIRVAGTTGPGIHVPSQAHIPARGQRYLVFEFQVSKTYKEYYTVLGLDFSSERNFEKVDLTLRFFGKEPRGQATFTFTGPFLYHKEVRDDAGGPATLRFDPSWYGDVRFRFATTISFDRQRTSVIIYDTSGRRSFPTKQGSGGGSGVTEAVFAIPGIPIEKVAAITVGEKPREKTFHNIQVAYPGRPERTHAAWVDVMTERLKLEDIPENDLAQYYGRTPQEALEIIDIIRGRRMKEALEQRIFSSDPRIDPNSLDLETKARLRRAAESWAGSPDLSIRDLGVRLGLWAGWPEYVTLALEMLKIEDPKICRAIARSLYLYKKDLQPAEYEQIKEVILASSNPYVLRHLFNLLYRDKTPHSRDIYLALVRDDRPWLWWRAINGLNYKGVLSHANDWPSELRLRVAIVLGPDHFAEERRFLSEKVKAVLPHLLTPEMAVMDSGTFSDILVRIEKDLDRPVATAALVAFLKNTAQRPVSFYVIAQVVTRLNALHGTNIAGLGGDAQMQRPREYWYDWGGVAEDAVGWHKTGVDPGSVPVECKSPKKGDLRIVWRDIEDREKSIIGVWVLPVDGVRRVRSFRITQGDKTFYYRLAPLTIDKRRPPVKEVLAYSYQIAIANAERGIISDDFHTHRASGRVAAQGLPAKVELKLRNKRLKPANEELKWECWIEPLTAPESVLSGTKLFEQWWQSIKTAEE